MEATTATATKFLVGVVAKKRWQKRGDKKEVVQRSVAKKRWQKRGDKKEVVQR